MARLSLGGKKNIAKFYLFLFFFRANDTHPAKTTTRTRVASSWVCLLLYTTCMQVPIYGVDSRVALVF
jgi:hypothetical protein